MQRPAPLVLRAGRLLDPASGTVMTGVFIVVDSGHIVTAGSRAAPPPDAEVIDLSAYTVLPGLIDAHVHLTIGGTARDNALATLRAGFTTVVDLGARTLDFLAARDSINAGTIPGPRVLAAGQWIGTAGGVCEFSGLGIKGGADAFAQRVRENVEAGGLMSYGPNETEGYRRAAAYVDRLLKGARASELAIERPAKIELAINPKTAAALGLALPGSLLHSADRIVR